MALRPLGFMVDDDVTVQVHSDESLIAIRYDGNEVLVNVASVPDLITALQQVRNIVTGVRQ